MKMFNFLLSTSVLIYSLIWEPEELKEDDILMEELVSSPAFQRLKGVDQSGPVSYLGTDNFIKYDHIGPMPLFSRYEHSLAVRWLVKEKAGGNIIEQAAALLHDASHTAFSHVGDHLFNLLGHSNSTQHCYQDQIHLDYLAHYGIENIINKYDITLSQLDHTQYKVLKTARGSLCADNLQYVVHAAVLLQLIDRPTAKQIIHSVNYDHIREEWFFDNIKYAKLFGNISIDLTKNIYTAPYNHVFYQYFTKAVLVGTEQQLFTLSEFQYGTDQPILEKLQQSDNILIQHYISRLDNISTVFDVVKYEEAADMKVNNLVLRAVDPKVKLSDNDDVVKLSDVDKEFAAEFIWLKNLCTEGYGIKFHQDELDILQQIKLEISNSGVIKDDMQNDC